MLNLDELEEFWQRVPGAVSKDILPLIAECRELRSENERLGLSVAMHRRVISESLGEAEQLKQQNERYRKSLELYLKQPEGIAYIAREALGG